MRRMTYIVIIMAAMMTGLWSCTEKTEIPTDMNGNGTTNTDSFQIQMTHPVPNQYFSEATEQGQVVKSMSDAVRLHHVAQCIVTSVAPNPYS